MDWEFIEKPTQIIDHSFIRNTNIDRSYMIWLNATDLLVNPEEQETARKVVFRQVGWLGQTGRMYPMGENPSETERGGFSPMYVQIAPD